MKWLAQYFISPLIAAGVAIWGNYYFLHKNEMKKEYTKLGVDILLRENAPEPVRALGRMMIEQNSPVRLSGAEKEAKLHELMKNIPFSQDLEKETTWGDIAARYGVMTEWVTKVSEVCPECINKSQFNTRFPQMKMKLGLNTKNGSK